MHLHVPWHYFSGAFAFCFVKQNTNTIGTFLSAFVFNVVMIVKSGGSESSKAILTWQILIKTHL